MWLLFVFVFIFIFIYHYSAIKINIDDRLYEQSGIVSFLCGGRIDFWVRYGYMHIFRDTFSSYVSNSIFHIIYSSHTSRRTYLSAYRLINYICFRIDDGWFYSISGWWLVSEEYNNIINFSFFFFILIGVSRAFIQFGAVLTFCELKYSCIWDWDYTIFLVLRHGRPPYVSPFRYRIPLTFCCYIFTSHDSYLIFRKRSLLLHRRR